MIGPWISPADHEWHRIDMITGEYVAEVIVDDDGEAHITIRSEAGEVNLTLESMGWSSKDRQRTAINAKAIVQLTLHANAIVDVVALEAQLHMLETKEAARGAS